MSNQNKQGIIGKITDTLGLTAVFAAAATVILLPVGYGLGKAGLNPILRDSDGAVETVQKAHADFTNVSATGYGWFACGFGESADLWRTDFRATNSNGEEVTGTVCDGLFKSATIRFD